MTKLPTLVPPGLGLAFLLCATLALADDSAAFLHADGSRLVDAAGREFLPRGVNLAGWLSPEPALMGAPNLDRYPGADDWERLEAALDDVLVWDASRKAGFWDAWRSNWVSAADLDFIQSQGFNVVRVPFHYRLFYEITNPAAAFPENGRDLEAGFAWLDPLVTECAARGLYVIPALHGPPGSADYAAPRNLYTHASNRALFLHLWQRIASRYAGNPAIAGYELLHQPRNSDGGSIPNQALSRVYADARDAIRAVDVHHLLFCAGEAGVWLSAIRSTGWTDREVCYVEHLHPGPLPLGSAQKAVALAHGVPLWAGELGSNSTHWLHLAVGELESASSVTAGGQTGEVREGWCYSPYKGTGILPLAGCGEPLGWQMLKAYWNNEVNAPSPEDAFAWLLEYAGRAALARCLRHGETVAALRRPGGEYGALRTPYRPGLRIPGRLAAGDYDLGANGLAYLDSVAADETGGQAWNEGWAGRNDGVDLVGCADETAGLKAGWHLPGEWQEYTVTSAPGRYHLNVRYSGGGQARVRLNGADLAGVLALPDTGSAERYVTARLATVDVSAAGEATVRIECAQGGYEWLWLEFEPAEGAPLAPSGLQAAVGNTSVALSWNRVSGASGYMVRRASPPGSASVEVGRVSATAFADQGLLNGVTYSYSVVATNGYGVGTETPEVAVTPAAGGLPEGWIAAEAGLAQWWNGDAGETGRPGRVSWVDGVWTLHGSGAGIGGRRDAFWHVFRPLPGDGEVAARMISQGHSNARALAGLMVRESLAADAPHFSVLTRPGEGLEVAARASAGADTAMPYAGAFAPPQWLKITRRGNQFRAWRSADGETWTPLGESATVTMGASAFAGLAVTAHDRFLWNQAVFDGVRALAAPEEEEPAPRLRASWREGGLRLAWEGSGPGWRLESTADLAASVWEPAPEVSATPAEAGWEMFVPASEGGGRFFRLVKSAESANTSSHRRR